jgi:hypothetical protein
MLNPDDMLIKNKGFKEEVRNHLLSLPKERLVEETIKHMELYETMVFLNHATNMNLKSVQDLNNRLLGQRAPNLSGRGTRRA